MSIRWRIGTSGWQYADWKGELYPANVPQRLWLEEYAKHFDTLELNNAFYRLPSRDTFQGWRDRLPADFVMSVKASRYLTHIKRLRDPAEPVSRLMSAACGLTDRLGPILLQLPPTLRCDPPLLARTLDRFPSGIRVAVEPRHPTWWTDAARAVLSDHNAALCWADRKGRPVTPIWRTADWGYLRLHEGRALPWPMYGRAALRAWVRRLSDAYSEADVFVYFNNDPGGAAVRNAGQLRAMIEARQN
jgi:uncharacterized protein YecE (DUF72 family)